MLLQSIGGYMTGILDYGMGNVMAISNMIVHLGFESRIISDPEDIRHVARVIIPGVGSFDNGMEKLANAGFTEALSTAVLHEKKPVLGICLGMQLLTSSSEEGQLPGLGWIDGETKKLAGVVGDKTYKIPHMGWNEIIITRQHPLMEGLEGSRFYFTHSYAVHCRDAGDVLCTCTYGQEITAGIGHENIFGVQFHPEKSHTFGMIILKNYIKMKT